MVSLPSEIDQRVRTVRAELIGQSLGRGTYSEAVCWLVAVGFDHRAELIERATQRRDHG